MTALAGPHIAPGMTYDPDSHADEWNIDVHVVDLGPGLRGVTDGTQVWLNLYLTQRERRSVLAHELVHIELGHGTRQPPSVERLVWRIAAERLIAFDELVEAVKGGLSLDEVAMDLNVCQTALLARLGGLEESQGRQLDRAIGRNWRNKPLPLTSPRGKMRTPLRW